MDKNNALAEALLLYLGKVDCVDRFSVEFKTTKGATSVMFTFIHFRLFYTHIFTGIGCAVLRSFFRQAS